jgi:type II secretory pathway component PulC
MTSRISGIVPLLLITLICIGCVEGGYLLFEHFVLDAPVAVESSEVVPLATESEMKKSGGDAPDYRIILQRNLFGPPPASGKDETAVVEAPDPAEDLAATNLEIVLMGTITGSKGVERAIILDKKSQEQELYEKGDSLHGAVVKNIERGKVIISREGKDEILDMVEAAKVRPPPPPPAMVTPVTAGGQGNLPVRAIPQPPVGIDPVTGGDNPAPALPANVERVKRSLVPQRIYRPSPPPRRQQ